MFWNSYTLPFFADADFLKGYLLNGYVLNGYVLRWDTHEGIHIGGIRIELMLIRQQSLEKLCDETSFGEKKCLLCKYLALEVPALYAYLNLVDRHILSASLTEFVRRI